MRHFPGNWHSNQEIVRRTMIIALGLILIAIIVWHVPDFELASLW